MIDLEEYKNELISIYRYEIDNSEIKRENRKEYLNKHYSDEYLDKIINDTYRVIKSIFDASEYMYYNIDMMDYEVSYISLDLTGGWFSDIIYRDANGNIISEHILKKTFGNSLTVEVREDAYDFSSDDPDIMSFDYRYSLYIQGFPKNMKSIKDNLFGSSKKMLKN